MFMFENEDVYFYVNSKYISYKREAFKVAVIVYV